MSLDVRKRRRRVRAVEVHQENDVREVRVGTHAAGPCRSAAARRAAPAARRPARRPARASDRTTRAPGSRGRTWMPDRA